MDDSTFETPGGEGVPAVTAEEMREVDRVATGEVGPPLPGMLENAGALSAREIHEQVDGPVAVVAGGGGNGAGGLACARHLANHGVDVRVVLDRDPDDLAGAGAAQWRALAATDAATTANVDVALDGAAAAVDAVVGYGLQGGPEGRVAGLIGAFDGFDGWVLSLDVPSGVDATTGERPGVAVSPDRTMTLALPKLGLASVGGELVLADVGIPAGVFERAGLAHESPFDGGARVPIWAP